MLLPPLFDLPNSAIEAADVVALPLPFEGTVSYGKGTANGPAAILQASTQVELFDEETGVDLEGLKFYTTDPIRPTDDMDLPAYLQKVGRGVRNLVGNWAVSTKPEPFFVGLGGEHSLTPPLLRGVLGNDDLSGVTVVQFDAHADLRDSYDGTPHSHACAMRRVVEAGGRVIAIGIRSLAREEYQFAQASEAIETFYAQQLAEDRAVEARLIERLRNLRGDVYVTFDIDALEVHLCGGTGTPQPGGLTWWQALRYLCAVLMPDGGRRILGADIVETAPMPHTVVNEMVAARLLAKMVCYRFRKR